MQKWFVTSNSFFYHSVFHIIRELSAIFIKFKIVVFKFFSLEESKICCSEKGYYKTKIMG